MSTSGVFVADSSNAALLYELARLKVHSDLREFNEVAEKNIDCWFLHGLKILCSLFFIKPAYFRFKSLYRVFAHQFWWRVFMRDRYSVRLHISYTFIRPNIKFLFSLFQRRVAPVLYFTGFNLRLVTHVGNKTQICKKNSKNMLMRYLPMQSRYCRLAITFIRARPESFRTEISKWVFRAFLRSVLNSIKAFKVVLAIAACLFCCLWCFDKTASLFSLETVLWTSVSLFFSALTFNFF